MATGDNQARVPVRIAVTGREGQLARSLVERAEALADVEVIPLARPQFDLADPAGLGERLSAARPDIVINAAAYTAVDKAESEPAVAHAINADGAGAVARACRDLGLPVIQISTDYVYSGDKTDPYLETDATGPVSVYGRTKLAGEHAVMAANPRHLIVRTAWVYSAFGANFVKTMLRLAAERESLTVVADQHGNPTSAHDLADGLLAAAREVLTPGFDNWGVVHMAGAGATSWAGFASHVMDQSRHLGGPVATIVPIPGDQYKTAARRPANSRLDTQKANRLFGFTPPPWQNAATQVVARLLGEG